MKVAVHRAIMPYRIRVKRGGIAREVAVDDMPIAKCRECGEIMFTLETDEAIEAAIELHFMET